MKHLTASTIADRLGVSRSRAYELMREMTRVVVGKSVRVSEQSFAAWLGRHTLGPCESTDEGSSTGPSFRTGASRSGSRTGKRPSLLLVNCNELPPIRLTYPRTKPRDRGFPAHGRKPGTSATDRAWQRWNLGMEPHGAEP